MGRLGKTSGSVAFEGEISPNVKKRTQAVLNAWQDQRDLDVKMRVKRLISLMLYWADPPGQPAAHPVMSADLQAVLGAIQQGAEERMEVIMQKKHQLEVIETKPKLVGHVELDKKGELLKMEPEPEGPEGDTEGGGA